MNKTAIRQQAAQKLIKNFHAAGKRFRSADALNCQKDFAMYLANDLLMKGKNLSNKKNSIAWVSDMAIMIMKDAKQQLMASK